MQLFELVPLLSQAKLDPQPPQLPSSLATLVVQPFSEPLQVSHDPVHSGSHAPAEHAVEFAFVVPHTVSHAPQSCTSESTFDSQPSARPPSQSRQLLWQPSKTHSPASQWASACAN